MDKVLAMYDIIAVFIVTRKQIYIETFLDRACFGLSYAIHVVCQIESTCSILYHHCNTMIVAKIIMFAG